jgi:hypothetical protein
MGVMGVRATSLIALLLGSLGVCSSVCADPVVPGEEHCVVNVRPGDSLNMRARPVATARQRDIVFLPYAVGNWQKIRVDGWQGWAYRRYLSGQ